MEFLLVVPRTESHERADHRAAPKRPELGRFAATRTEHHRQGWAALPLLESSQLPGLAALLLLELRKPSQSPELGRATATRIFEHRPNRQGWAVLLRLESRTLPQPTELGGVTATRVSNTASTNRAGRVAAAPPSSPGSRRHHRPPPTPRESRTPPQLPGLGALPLLKFQNATSATGGPPISTLPMIADSFGSLVASCGQLLACG